MESEITEVIEKFCLEAL